MTDPTNPEISGHITALQEAFTRCDQASALMRAISAQQLAEKQFGATHRKTAMILDKDNKRWRRSVRVQ